MGTDLSTEAEPEENPMSPKLSVKRSRKKKDHPRGNEEEEDEEEQPPSEPSSSSSNNMQLQPYDPHMAMAREAGSSAGSGQVLEMFSTRKPKNIVAGVSSGLKSTVKGVAAGVGSVFLMPALGATQEGVGGFFKGLGAGLVMAVVMPVTGAVVGVTQVARGCYNTPEAIKQQNNDMKWDKEKREWKKNWYSLTEERAEVAEQLEDLRKRVASQSHERRSQPRTVAETHLYEVLGVETNATSAEIRKAYYQLARTSHPDKHPDDPEAKAKFQALGEAYQVLGDENRRAQYDKEGDSAAANMSMIECSLFFTMLFGSEELEPYVGKLQMVLMVEMQDDDSEDSAKLAKLEQQAREVGLGILLRDRLLQYVEGSEAEKTEWKARMREEADTLCKQSYGDAIVEAVGWTYENYADQFLGKQDSVMGWGKRYAKLQAKKRTMGNYWKSVEAATRFTMAQRKANQRVKKQGETEDGGMLSPQLQQEALPLFLEGMFSFCRLDIEKTVKAASKKVVKDMDACPEKRRERAEALEELGKIMQDAAKAHDEANEVKRDARDQLEEALLKAHKKANADDDEP
eukprot:GHVN01081179.1.p1 GENE.GHVN01081179.1~~GHVN01081179.1.p1  ORF type:complete len:572 (+),score=102.03 GHVN01081179.1:242-1957(+)